MLALTDAILHDEREQQLSIQCALGSLGTFRESAFKKGEVTLGSVVKNAGYKTGFVGKWHLGGDFRDLKTGGAYRGTDDGDISGKVDVKQVVGFGPKDCGFDYDFTLPCGIQGPIYTAYENESWYPLASDSKIVYLNEENAIHPKDVTSKGPGMGDSGWGARLMGKLLSKKAVGFINSNANTEEPFFRYYCSPIVHVPHCPRHCAFAKWQHQLEQPNRVTRFGANQFRKSSISQGVCR